MDESSEPLAPLATHEVVAIAAAALCDVKTVRSFLRDGPVRPSLRARIIAALRKRGWLERAKFGIASVKAAES